MKCLNKFCGYVKPKLNVISAKYKNMNVYVLTTQLHTATVSEKRAGKLEIVYPTTCVHRDKMAASSSFPSKCLIVLFFFFFWSSPFLMEPVSRFLSLPNVAPQSACLRIHELTEVLLSQLRPLISCTPKWTFVATNLFMTTCVLYIDILCCYGDCGLQGGWSSMSREELSTAGQVHVYTLYNLWL